MRYWMFVGCCFSFCFSQAADPSLEEIVEGHVRALGGAENLAAVKSLKLSGTYAYNGLDHGMAIYRQRPGKIRFEIEGLELYGTTVTPGKQVVRAYDGKTAWGLGENAEVSGPYDLGPEIGGIMGQRADFDGSLVGYGDKGHQLRLVGASDVDGTPAWHLELTPAQGMKEHWHLHKESFLPLKLEIETSEGGFTKPLAWFFDDWREVSGIKLPFFVYVQERLFSREHLIETVEVNPDLPDSLFSKPPE